MAVLRFSMLLSIPMASVMYLHIGMQEEDILELTYATCHMCILQ